MPEKETTEQPPPQVDVFQPSTNEAIIMILMVLLQLVYYVNIDPCTC